MQKKYYYCQHNHISNRIWSLLVLPRVCACHFSILLYQVHWKHSDAIRAIPAVTTSKNAIKNELCGERPAVARASIYPSKLQGMINLPALMPFRAFWATSLAFIRPEEATIKLVICGFVLFSADSMFQLVNSLWLQEKIEVPEIT